MTNIAGLATTLFLQMIIIAETALKLFMQKICTAKTAVGFLLHSIPNAETAAAFLLREIFMAEQFQNCCHGGSLLAKQLRNYCGEGSYSPESSLAASGHVILSTFIYPAPLIVVLYTGRKACIFPTKGHGAYPVILRIASCLSKLV